jgi:hypothetical protein
MIMKKKPLVNSKMIAIQGDVGARVIVGEGEVFWIDGTGDITGELVLNKNSLVKVRPHIQTLEFQIANLVLNGPSTFDLTPDSPDPLVPEKPKTPSQAVARGPNPVTGKKGVTGSPGLPGLNGINLVLTINNLDMLNGSLWIKTDGRKGGPGGPGGDGGKGSSGPIHPLNNPDGGAGGRGGDGGPGGKGGNSAKAVVKYGGNTLNNHRIEGFAPSKRPDNANHNNFIVVAGAPGLGGDGGRKGKGGPGGEGHEGNSPFNTDSNDGPRGADGKQGLPGPNGNFVE